MDKGLIGFSKPKRLIGRLVCVKRVFDRGEFNAPFADLDAPTDDDVSITTDGRRLDSVEAVMAFVEHVARDRAAAERAG